MFSPFASFVPMFAFACTWLSGCVLPELDLEGRACPCIDGYVCNAESICVPADAGLDAGSPSDAGPVLDVGADDVGAVDGGMNDSGPNDVGVDAPDAGPDETACDEALGEALFCESFEMPLTWSPGADFGDGTVGVATPSELPMAGAYRGEGALRGAITAGRGYAELATEFSAEGILSGPLYVRAYAYLPGDVPIIDLSLVHVGLHRTRYAEETVIGFNVFTGTDDPSISYAGMFVGAGPTGQVHPDLVPIPRDRWFCLQLDLVLDPVDGSASIWVDGEPAGGVTGIDTEPPNTGFHHIGAGIAFSNLEQLPMEVLVDEIAIGLSPLPCDPR